MIQNVNVLVHSLENSIIRSWEFACGFQYCTFPLKATLHACIYSYTGHTAGQDVLKKLIQAFSFHAL